MKNHNSILMLVNVLILFMSISVVGQDLVNFTFVDHFSVGLTATPYEKWGQAVADIDNNGWPDIFCRRWNGVFHSRVYLNFDGVFQDITDQTPLESIEQGTHTRTVSIVDYDNDGDRDIFFGGDERMYLLRNDDNVFTEIAETVGLVGQKPPGFINQWEYNIGAWIDIDLDGDLDVLVCQTNNPDYYLFRNDDGFFTDMAQEYGLVSLVPPGSFVDAGNWSSRLHWVDFDMDGDFDLSSGRFLFRNESGQFTEVAETLGLMPSESIQNSEWFDFDNDGDLDFIKGCSGYSEPEGCTVELWENQDGMFVDATEKINLMSLLQQFSRGLTVGDFDNDGDQDIFIDHNWEESLDALLLNHEFEPGDRYFDNIAELVGITVMGDRKGGVFFDYDKDGFLDLYIPAADVNHHLYHNDRNENNWVGFILEGTQSNRDAIGSVVKLYAEGGIQVRYTKCPDGWLRQNNPWIHFGLGQSTDIDSVVIRWPLGLVEVLTNVTINQYHEIKEGDATSKVSSNKNKIPADYCLEQNYPNPFNPETTISYKIAEAGVIQISIYNMNGKLIQNYSKLHKSSGRYKVEWHGLSTQNEIVQSGLYIYRMEINGFVATKKMLLVK
jgi:hypothetical protein